MAGLQSFEDFTKLKAEKLAAEEAAKQTEAREETARSFKDLLAEYGVTKVSELDEEKRGEFFSRLEGTDLNESLSLVTEGTRSFFGKINRKGDIEAVYMHYDGYPENMLPLIQKGYSGSKRKNVDVVLQNGAGSGLEADPKKINYYNDGDEPLTGNVGSIRNFIGDAKDSWAEYIYLYDERDGEWYMVDTYKDSDLKPAFESLELNEGLNKSDVQYQLEIDYSGNTAPKVTKLNKKTLEVKYGYKVSPQHVIDSIKSLYPEVELEHLEWRDIMSGGGVHSFAIKESVDVNEAVGSFPIEERRTAKKVVTQYNHLFGKTYTSLVDGGKMQLGAIKVLFQAAMEDANFSREGNAIMKHIKGALSPIVTTVSGLGNIEAKVSAKRIQDALYDEASRISNAAEWGGLGIVEGTALYLDSIGHEIMAAQLVADFHAQFESREVMEARILEGNEFGAARAKAIADGEDEFEVGGKKYPVTKVDKDDKENAEEFAGESAVTEAEIKSADEFKEYAFTVLQKAFGEDFDEAKAQEVVDGILDKCGDDYGACVGMLQSSLG